MGGVAYWLRTWHRRRILGLAGVAVVAVGALGFVMLAALGMFRAGTAWDRLRGQTRAEDVFVDATTIAAAESLTRELGEVGGVEHTATIAYSYLVPNGRVEDFFGGAILAFDRGALDEIWRPVVLDGRLPDPARPDEVVVNRSYLEASGADLGSEIELVDPIGLIRQPVTIVGVGVLPVDFTFGAGSPLAFTTPAFTEQWAMALAELEDQGGTDILGGGTLVRAEPGVDPDDLSARLVDAARPGEVGGVTVAASSAALVVDTLQFQRNGYAVLSLAAALASLAVLGLLLARACVPRPEEAVALRALGFSRRDDALVVLVPGVVVALAGTIGATILAVAVEGFVPTGLADLVAADRAAGDDWALLGLAALTSALAVVALAVFVAWRSTAAVRTAGTGRHAPARLLRWPALAVGLWATTGGRSRRGGLQALAALAVVTVAAVGISVVTVVQSSRHRISVDPSLAGHFFDVNIGVYTDAELAGEDQDRLLASESITALGTIEDIFADVDGIGVEGIVVTAHRGSLAPPAITGRLPSGADEIAVSPNYLRQQGLRLGERIELSGPVGTRDFEITGTVVFPFAGTSALGEQILLTPAGRDLLGVEPIGYSLVADVRDPDALRGIHAPNEELDTCTTEQLLPVLGVDALPGAHEQGIGPCFTRLDQRAANLRELGTIPAVLMLFLAVLGIAGLALLLGMSIRRTRQDLAVLRALGCTRPQTMIAVLIQGAAVGAVGAVLGRADRRSLLGRWVWGLTVDDIGLVDRPVVSIAAVGGLILGAVVVAMLVAAIPGSRGRPQNGREPAPGSVRSGLVADHIRTRRPRRSCRRCAHRPPTSRTARVAGSPCPPCRSGRLAETASG